MNYQEYRQFIKAYKKKNKKPYVEPQETTLTDEEIDELIDELALMGFRYQILSEEFDKVKDFVLPQGELLYVIDQNLVKIGNGSLSVENLPAINLDDVTVGTNDLPAVQASKICLQMLAKHADLGVYMHLMHDSVLSELKKLLPPQFSFMLGEELSDISPLKNWWRTSPKSQGLILRNLNHDILTNDPDGRSKRAGDIDKNQMLAHTHETDIRIFKFEIDREDPNAKVIFYPYNTITFEHDAYYNTNYTQRSNLYLKMAGNASEDRGVNLRVVFIWRIA